MVSFWIDFGMPIHITLTQEQLEQDFSIIRQENLQSSEQTRDLTKNQVSNLSKIEKIQLAAENYKILGEEVEQVEVILQDCQNLVSEIGENLGQL